ncbi:hypothetical protein [Thalassospira sp.]|uniref:hypothetical protein n=1 Tax=Thalassospira sp. TaxID=1912094 RepID=UPI0032EBACE5
MEEAKIVEHFENHEMQNILAHHTQEIARLKTNLEDLSSSINMVINALGPHACSKDIRAFFDDEAEQIQRTKLDLAHHKRALADNASPRKLDAIIQHHKKLVAELGNPMCQADFDFEALLARIRKT